MQSCIFCHTKAIFPLICVIIQFLVFVRAVFVLQDSTDDWRFDKKCTLWFCQIQNPPLVSHFAEHGMAVFIEHSAQLNFSSNKNPIYLLTNMISPARKIWFICSQITWWWSWRWLKSVHSYSVQRWHWKSVSRAKWPSAHVILNSQRSSSLSSASSWSSLTS